MITKDTQANHWASKDCRIIQSYWNSPPAIKRSLWFTNQLKNYNFDSIFEVGYFSGRNLKYICDKFKNIHVSGLEINKKAVGFAREKLKNLDLLSMNLHNMDSILRKYDIVFSSGVLIHIPPDDLKSVVKKMIGLSSKYIMHIESIGETAVSAGPKHLNPTYKVSDQVQWIVDLQKIYTELGFDAVKIINLPNNCKTNGASELVIVEIK